MPASLLDSQLDALEEPDPLSEAVMTIDVEGRCPGKKDTYLWGFHSLPL